MFSKKKKLIEKISAFNYRIYVGLGAGGGGGGRQGGRRGGGQRIAEGSKPVFANYCEAKFRKQGKQ